MLVTYRLGVCDGVSESAGNCSAVDSCSETDDDGILVVLPVQCPVLSWLMVRRRLELRHFPSKDILSARPLFVLGSSGAPVRVTESSSKMDCFGDFVFGSVAQFDPSGLDPPRELLYSAHSDALLASSNGSVESCLCCKRDWRPTRVEHKPNRCLFEY